MEDHSDAQHVNSIRNFKVDVTKLGKLTIIHGGLE